MSIVDSTRKDDLFFETSTHIFQLAKTKITFSTRYLCAAGRTEAEEQRRARLETMNLISDNGCDTLTCRDPSWSSSNFACFALYLPHPPQYSRDAPPSI
jgi:hypothetical protein